MKSMNLILDAGYDAMLAPRSRRLPSGAPGGPVRSDALIVSGNPMNGTADDDFMFGFSSGPDHMINADAGDDLVLGEIGQFSGNSGPSSNGTRGSAFSLDGASIWTTDENPLFGDDSIPHATAYVAAGGGQEEFYSLTIGAGETITIDVDYGGGIIGAHTDTVVDLLASNGDMLATNNDSSMASGGWGSADGFDSFLSFTVATAGLYFIRVYESVTPLFEGGEEFLLNISLTGQATIPGAVQGADTIDGGDGDDELFGVGGDDSIGAGTGDDLLVGGTGADTLTGGAGADALDGGGGSDWADYANAALGVTADLQAPANNTGDAAGDCYVAIENLRGSAATDTLFGSKKANRIEGFGEDDALNGRKGDDTLAGHTGRDRLTGGSGADRFELASVIALDADRILDFTPGDEIALHGALFGLTPGALGGGRFVLGRSAGDAGDRIIYNPATGKLWFDADGSGAQAQVLIATLTNTPTLDAKDFTVI